MSYSCYIKNQSNNILYIMYDNKNCNRKFKLLLCNKGNSHFQNKINDVINIFYTHECHIICMSQANINWDNKNFKHEFPQYNIELNKMSQLCNILRNAIFIYNSIPYKRIYDWEDDMYYLAWN